MRHAQTPAQVSAVVDTQQDIPFGGLSHWMPLVVVCDITRVLLFMHSRLHCSVASHTSF